MREGADGEARGGGETRRKLEGAQKESQILPWVLVVSEAAPRNGKCCSKGVITGIGGGGKGEGGAGEGGMDTL